MNLLVSIVIPTFNSENTIDLCLKSICAQTYKNIEIIVVDNNSLDSTVEIAKKYTKNVYLQKGERSTQRNFGFKKAKGEIFLYLDSDMVLSRDVVQDAVDKLQKNTNCVGLYIPEIVEGDTFLTKILNFERSFYNETVVDAVRIVKADVFKKAKGFDENLIACEDWDLDRRIRDLGKTEIIKSPLYHLQYRLTLKNYIRKKIYYSEFTERYVNKWGKNDAEIKKQFGFIYRFFLVYVENYKWRKLFRSPVKTFFMYIMKIIIGVIYLTYHYDNSNYRSGIY